MVRLALKALRRRWVAALSAFLPLALAIGATTAAFSVVWRVLLRPLPLPEAHRLVFVRQHIPNLGGTLAVSPANYLDMKAGLQAIEALAAYQSVTMTISGRGEPAVVSVTQVTASFFDTLRMRPLHGRPFVDGEAAAGDLSRAILRGGDRAILSYGLAERLFGDADDATRHFLLLDGRPHQVVGVMPPDFAFPDGTDAWVPLLFGAMAPQDRGGFYLQCLGRLAPGVHLPTARADLDRLARQLRTVAPRTNGQLALHGFLLQDELVRGMQLPLFTLLGLSVVILVGVCANTGHFLLAQMAERDLEMAIRVALGSGPPHVFQQALIESLALVVPAGVLGMGLARLLLGVVGAALPPHALPQAAICLDPVAALFAVGLTVLIGTLFALVPLAHAFSSASRASLSSFAHRGSASRRQLRQQRALVAVQFALSLVLLLLTLLLGRTYLNLNTLARGFEASGVLTADLRLPAERYQRTERSQAFVEQALAELRSLPGVTAAAVSLRLPIVDAGGGIWFRLPARDGSVNEGEEPAATFNTVSPDYFDVMRLPIVVGRAFLPSDNDASPAVTVVSRELAQRFFPGQNAVGRRIILPPWPTREWEIVGIAADVRQGGLRVPPVPAVYVPYAQHSSTRLRFVMRYKGDPRSLAASIRSRMERVDPVVGLERVETMTHRVRNVLRPERLALRLAEVFGLLGVVLAAFGVYSVTALFMRQRVTEIGVRMALGARASDIVRWILRGAAIGVVSGVAVGVPLGLLAARAVSSFLFEVRPTDALSLALAIGLLCAAAVVATIIPCRRAILADPLTGLRQF